MATFGKTTNDASIVTYTSDRKVTSLATPASSGTITSGTVRAYTTTAVNVPSRMVVYSDNAGTPNELLAVSDDLTWNSDTEVEINFTFSGANQISVVSGTGYWIGMHYDYTTQGINISRANTTGKTKSNNDTFADGAAATFGALATTNGPIDAYITYTETAGTVIKDVIGSGFIPFAR